MAVRQVEVTSQTRHSGITVIARAPVNKSSRRNADAGWDELRRRLRESSERKKYISSSARATAVPRKLSSIQSSVNLPPTMYERDTMFPTASEDTVLVRESRCDCSDPKTAQHYTLLWRVRRAESNSQGSVRINTVSSVTRP